MSTKAQAVWEQLSALPPEEQQVLWRELGRRLGQKVPTAPVEPYGEPLTDEDIEQSARVTFQMLDEKEKRARMNITSKGQVTIPPAMRKKHGLLPQREVEFVDQPDGVLVVKAGKFPRGKRVVAALLDGGRIKGRTAEWLRLTRSET